MDLNLLLKDAYVNLKQIYGDELVKVILYGSYARGDYHEYSDIDILALVNYDDTAIRSFRKKLISAMSDLDDKYSALVSIKVNNINYFDRYKNSLPYFKNIVKDGREVNVWQG